MEATPAAGCSCACLQVVVLHRGDRPWGEGSVNLAVRVLYLVLRTVPPEAVRRSSLEGEGDGHPLSWME